MSVAKALVGSLCHPSEMAALIRFKLQSEPQLATTADKDRPTSTRDLCLHFLRLTSRSFARVIQELDEELRMPVCVFYLILRGLDEIDTIEDDMTLPLERKVTLLKKFHEYIKTPKWTFQESGPDEKDAPLLKAFDCVIAEFLQLKSEYQTVILDITRRMGYGMSEFCDPLKKVVSVQDFQLYMHYVAGLVGIGLTDLFSASKLESKALKHFSALPNEAEPLVGGNGNGKDIANRMGLFLQSVNILKDYLQDLKEGRVFWPEEVWRQYAPNPDTDDISVFSKPENLDRGIAVLNHLCAEALTLVPDCLEYMSKIQNPTVFRFCAIPQMMAMSTILLFFNNPKLFQTTGTKIRRGLAVKLILASTDIESVKSTYQKYVLELHGRNHAAVNKYNTHDKSFFKISIALGKIQQWINEHSLGSLPDQKRVGEKPFYIREHSKSPFFMPLAMIIIALMLQYAYAW